MRRFHRKRGSLAPPESPFRNGRVDRGFSLVEMIAVVALVSLLMAFAAPSLLSLSPARKAAAHELAGVLEKARARAISSQREVYVAFADGGFPSENDRFRAYALFTAESRDREAFAEGSTERPLRMVSPWHRLREGIVFGTADHFETSPDLSFRTLHDAGIGRPFPVRGGAGGTTQVNLPHLAFGPSGSVAIPGFADADALYLAVVEGRVEAESGQVTLTRTRPGTRGGTFAQGELVGISYYSGRSTVLTE